MTAMPTTVITRTKRLLLAGVMGIAAYSIAFNAAAQGYPNRPIRLIVPYPPGGNTDVVARLISTHMSQKLGQPIVVDNKPGGSTIIGTDLLSKAAPDGYTIGLITDSLAINPMFFDKLPYDSVKDFEMVSQLVSVPLVLLARSSLNIRNVQELIALGKAQPGKLNYASIGEGSPHHLLMEWLKAMTGIQMTHIPYRGVAQALTDVAGGQVDLMISGTATISQFLKSGKLVALGVTGAKREASLPDVPTIAEQGLPQFELTTLGFAIAAPAGTPRAVVARLNQEIASALAVPEVKERLEGLGTVGTHTSLTEAGTIIDRVVAQWSRIIKASGVKAITTN